MIGCIGETTPEQAKAEYAKKNMVGLSRAAVIGRAGEPDRTDLKESGKVEVLVYWIERFEKKPHTGTELRDFCEASFRIVKGRVESLSYTGNSGGSMYNRNRVCAPLIEKCVAHVKSTN